MGNFSRGFFTGVLISYFLITVVTSTGPRLMTKPEGPILTKPIGKDFFLICQLDGEDPNRITDLRWLTPYNETITSEGIMRQGMKMSTEKFPNNALIFTITSLTEAGAGIYTCTGLFGSERLSSSITVKTFVEITWEDAPTEQFPTLNKDYKVKCKVVANPAPYVDWLKNDDKIETNDHYIIEADGLIIKNAQVTDDGAYTCRAYNADIGSMNKRIIKVEVHVTPSFDNNETRRTLEVVEGETVDITCHAQGKPPPSYAWIKSNTKANLGMTGDRYSVNDQTGSLTITNVRQDDNGDMICEARNAAGYTSQIVTVTVIIKPSVYDIKNITVPTKQMATLECKATGNPLPSITFRRIGSSKNMISGAQPQDSRIVIEQRVDEQRRESIGSLIITNLHRSDDGLYTCVARNKGGEATKNGHLQVEFAPSFANTPMKEAWSWNRKIVNLTCLAESIPNATIIWRLNERILEGNPYFKQEGHGPSSSLLVTPSSPEYYGNYKCEASNIHGRDFHTIKLYEAHPPGRILQSKVEVVTATTITFKLIGPSEIGGRPIKAFVVQYKREEQFWSEARNKTWSADSSYIVEGLEPQTSYNFRFAAVNEVGMGQFDADHKFVMPKRSFPEEPRILDNLQPEGFIMSPYDNRFELRWKRPADNGEPIDYYEIKYCTAEKSNSGWSSSKDNCAIFEHRTNEISSYDLGNLLPETYYQIELRAHNAIGYSTPAETVIRTARDPSNSGTYPVESSANSLLANHIIATVASLLFMHFKILK